MAINYEHERIDHLTWQLEQSRADLETKTLEAVGLAQEVQRLTAGFDGSLRLIESGATRVRVLEEALEPLVDFFVGVNASRFCRFCAGPQHGNLYVHIDSCPVPAARAALGNPSLPLQQGRMMAGELKTAMDWANDLLEANARAETAERDLRVMEEQWSAAMRQVLTLADALRGVVRVIEQVDFSPYAGVYDSIPWSQAEAALESLEPQPGTLRAPDQVDGAGVLE
tara:strand:+ start:20 stop:697 length:678 start_codon:yes stop_codon:yes gene_type:complete